MLGRSDAPVCVQSSTRVISANGQKRSRIHGCAFTGAKSQARELQNRDFTHIPAPDAITAVAEPVKDQRRVQLEVLTGQCHAAAVRTRTVGAMQQRMPPPSDCLSTRAPLTPSPVMPTTCPRSCSSLTMR